jgi:asparagine synthase (glutamine-hydrolysing)
MCGIAGIIVLNDHDIADAGLAERMADCLRHRGPDDEGLFISSDKRAALAFRRLAIIDLSTGRQPIANEDNTLHILCNGEIFNYKSLRTSLEKQNHHFTTAGDIEPILHLYEERGPQFLDALDGFFALAILDERAKKLTLAVDRYGKKPIYLGVQDGVLYFASELKAIKSVITKTCIDKNAVVDYLRFGYVPAPGTIYEKIYKLPPGHKLEIDLTRPDLPSPTCYYRLAPDHFDGSYDHAKRILSDLFPQAVEKRLMADVPLGMLLSGGLDSSIITAIAARLVKGPIKTFSVGFKNDLYNELPLARLVASRYKTDHTEIMVSPDVEGLLELVLQIYDEPFADSSAIPTYLVCQKAREFVKVALTGDGGDEAFTGYDRYRGFAITSLLAKLKLKPIGGFLSGFFTWPGPEQRSKRARFWRMIRAMRFSQPMQYSFFMRLFYEYQLRSLAGPELKPILASHDDFVAQTLISLAEKNGAAEKANLTDIATYLPGDLLVKMDRASMAVSLETRSPMLDKAVMEFAHSLPRAYRCDRRHGKKILRDTFGELLPPELLRAPKRGFGVPMGEWLRTSLRGQMESILNPHCRLIQEGYFAQISLVRLQAEHLAGLFDHSARLWSLMVLETFLGKNKE